MEGKKFQIKTDKKIIDGISNEDDADIRWHIQGVAWFTFSTESINSARCNHGYLFNDSDLQTKGFFLRAGTLTFQKTSTQLQVWFDDVLEVTWVYEDNDADNHCVMRKPMTGLKFKTPAGREDKVSSHYRYELGMISAPINRSCPN